MRDQTDGGGGGQQPDYIQNWADLPGQAFWDLDRKNTVVVVACSPIEVHGPHLPTCTDYCEAEGLMTRTLHFLHQRHPEIRFLRLPPIYAVTDVVPMPGSIHFRTSTTITVLTDLGRSLVKQGFRKIWVGNFHGSPRHFLAIEAAAHRVNKRYHAEMISVFSLLGKRMTKGTSDVSELLAHIEGLSKELLEGDSHGGAVETSMMLHLLKQYIGPYQQLPRRTLNIKQAESGNRPVAERADKVSIWDRIRGLAAAARYFETESYAGDPAAGSPEIGARVLDFLSKESAVALGELWRDEIGPSDCHSPIWPLRHLFLSPVVGKLFNLVTGHRNAIF